MFLQPRFLNFIITCTDTQYLITPWHALELLWSLTAVQTQLSYTHIYNWYVGLACIANMTTIWGLNPGIDADTQYWYQYQCIPFFVRYTSDFHWLDVIRQFTNSRVGVSHFCKQDIYIYIHITLTPSCLNRFTIVLNNYWCFRFQANAKLTCFIIYLSYIIHTVTQ